MTEAVTKPAGGRPAQRGGEREPHLVHRRRARHPGLPRHRHPRAGRARPASRRSSFLLHRGTLPTPGAARGLQAALAGERAACPTACWPCCAALPAARPSHDRPAHRGLRAGGVRPGRGRRPRRGRARPQGPAPDRADGDGGGRHRPHPPRAGRPCAPTRGSSHAANFLYMLDGRAARRRGRGARHGRGPRAPRRPRVQRLHLRGPRGRLHAGRRARRRHRRPGHPQGAAARRRQRGGDADAGGDRRARAGGGLGARDAFAQKRKIMGFGHAVYKTEDPRATHLRRMSPAARGGDGRATLVRPVASGWRPW